MNNYWKLRKFSLLNYYYAYLDSEDNLADQLFVSHKVYVSFGKEFTKEGSPYKVIFCKIRKKDEKPFLDALAGLDNKMLLGHTDYKKFYEEIKSQMLQVFCILFFEEILVPIIFVEIYDLDTDIVLLQDSEDVLCCSCLHDDPGSGKVCRKGRGDWYAVLWNR